jgi:methylglutaconyl-CoA hydratase
VHGAALGGGTGLAAACDVALAAESATFGFTEVRLGIVPAVISPYAIDKLGAARARALFVQGITFGGREAERLGLVFRCHADAELLAGAEAVLAAIRRCGPLAVRAAKELLREVMGLDPESAQERTVDTIAGIRATAEAREGLSAFLDKRPPTWT